MAEMQTISSLRTPGAKSTRTVSPKAGLKVHLPFLITAVVLVVYGLIVSFSATYGNANYSFPKQAMGVVLGIFLMLIFWKIDYHQMSDYVMFFLIVNVVLIFLPALPVVGLEVNGARSWFKLGPLSFQPGEFAKVSVILLAACVVSRYGGNLNRADEYLKALLIMAVPFVCILTQPDLGTGLVYLFIGGVALIIGGARAKYILITLAVIAGGIIALFTLDPILDEMTGSDVLLKEYQRSRLLVFLDPSYDLAGDGYNLQQAKIAIGSGGLFGKGFLNATQSTLGYLPESATDFVFCVLAEQFGFVGALVLLGLYTSLVFNGFSIAKNSNDLFGTVVVVCICGMWIFQVLENIGMDCGLMPITGIPLPFVSYGTSMMLVNFVCLGLILSVWAHNGRH
ncbi:MAG: rod shape-determining protein RodA [Eggerthellales bacterium]|nr:rod shape-determining protein RodA [Eggerthellales bacterium]